MEYHTLGSTGLEVSSLCVGTWRFGKESSGVVETDRDQAHQLLDEAWAAGINFFDTANVYGDPNGTSERWIGEWLSNHTTVIANRQPEREAICTDGVSSIVGNGTSSTRFEVLPGKSMRRRHKLRSDG